MTMENFEMLLLEKICLNKTFSFIMHHNFCTKYGHFGHFGYSHIVTKEHYDSSWLGVLYKVAGLTGPSLGNLAFFVPEVRYRGIAQ